LKNLSGALAVNDTFKVFNASSTLGSFSSVVSQTPGQVVTWDVSQVSAGGNGTVKVASAAPAPITATVSGGTLNLSWPAGSIGATLQVQTNSLSSGLGTNWVAVPNSASVNTISIPVNPAAGAVFYRLTF
jgi:hypothetical protein